MATEEIRLDPTSLGTVGLIRTYLPGMDGCEQNDLINTCMLKLMKGWTTQNSIFAMEAYEMRSVIDAFERYQSSQIDDFSVPPVDQEYE